LGMDVTGRLVNGAAASPHGQKNNKKAKHRYRCPRGKRLGRCSKEPGKKKKQVGEGGILELQITGEVHMLQLLGHHSSGQRNKQTSYWEKKMSKRARLIQHQPKNSSQSVTTGRKSRGREGCEHEKKGWAPKFQQPATTFHGEGHPLRPRAHSDALMYYMKRRCREPTRETKKPSLR